MRLVAWVAAGTALTALCMGLLDRPVADYVSHHLLGTPLSRWLGTALSGLRPAGAIVLTGLLAGLGWVASGRVLPPGIRPWLAAGWSGLLALGIAVLFKLLLGRPDVYPTWVMTHEVAFRFGHGGAGYSSFPSATAAGGAGCLYTLWFRRPSYRGAALCVYCLLIAAIVLTNGHWLSDTIAGGFLGAGIGWMTNAGERRGGGREAPGA